MIRGLYQGAKAHIHALKFLFNPSIIFYLILSGFLSLVVFGLIGTGIYFFGDDLGANLISFLPFNALPSFLRIGAEWFTRIVLWIVSILIFKHIILIIASPLLSTISEKVEEKITGDVINMPTTAMASISRGIRLSSSHIVKELMITAVLLVLSFIPGAAIVTTPLIFIVQAYYAGAGNLDFFMERRYNLNESKLFFKRHRGIAIANGALFLGLLIIPIVGVFLAPTWATISATIAALDTSKL